MTTEIENGEEAGKPQVSGRVKIEWNWDLDDEGQQIKSIGLGAQKYVLGPETATVSIPCREHPQPANARRC